MRRKYTGHVQFRDNKTRNFPNGSWLAKIREDNRTTCRAFATREEAQKYVEWWVSRNPSRLEDAMDCRTQVERDFWTELQEIYESCNRNQWQLGDMLVERLPRANQHSGRNQGITETLQQVADTLGVSFGTVYRWRLTSMKFPPDERRPFINWSTHMTFALSEARKEIFMEVTSKNIKVSEMLKELQTFNSRSRRREGLHREWIEFIDEAVEIAADANSGSANPNNIFIRVMALWELIPGEVRDRDFRVVA